MNGIDVNKVTQWLGIIVLAITTVVNLNNLFHTVEDHELRLKKIEADETVKKQLAEIQTSVQYLNWNMDALKKASEKKR